MIKKTVFCVLVMTLALSMYGCVAFKHREAAFYVAPDGNANNPGTKAKPFLTLDQARIAVRRQLQAGQKKDIVVMATSSGTKKGYCRHGSRRRLYA
jgi:hypothetical protein